MNQRPTLAYKILTTPEMEELEHRGSFAGAPADLADGYVHMSAAAQLGETLARHFAGQDDLHIAAVDLEALGDAVKWEKSRDDERFPHLYGPLPLDAIVAYSPLEYHEDGTVRLPVAG